MFKKFFSNFLINTLTFGFGSLILGIPVLIYVVVTNYNPLFSLPIFFFFFLIVGYFSYDDIIRKKDEDIKKISTETELKINEAEKKVSFSQYNEELWKKSLKERTAGFPSLFQSIEYYENMRDNKISDYLRYKPHPALSSAEIVKQEAKRRREAEFMQRKTQAIIEYYENIAPFLLDFKEQEIDETEVAFREYSEAEREDPITNFLTKEEFHKLTSIEKNQMALDRFWSRPKSKWLLGRIYERYVGFVYEQQGYLVEYTGIFKGYEDLGRDLICSKGNEVIIIQCKNWSQFKTIFEKHIFQFFGTVFQYRDQFPNKRVRAIFYTTTELSDLARRFAHELKIELEEKFKMSKNYPCIKCNISQVDGTKIYHLPFDQQYDNTKIEYDKGEFYCTTVEEAENKGFRRAFRWKGTKAD